MLLTLIPTYQPKACPSELIVILYQYPTSLSLRVSHSPCLLLNVANETAAVLRTLYLGTAFSGYRPSSTASHHMLLEASHAAGFLQRPTNAVFPIIRLISTSPTCRMNALPQPIPTGLLQEHFTCSMQSNQQSCKQTLTLDIAGRTTASNRSSPA